MDMDYGMSASAFKGYNRAHGITGLVLSALLLLLPTLTNGGISPGHTCGSGVAAAVPATPPAEAATVAAPAVAATGAAVAATSADALPPAARVFFAVGKSDVTASADTALAGVVGYLKTHDTAKAVVQGYHDPTGDKAANAALAKARAMNVAATLATLGIAKDRVVLEKPIETQGTGSAEEARRVEVSVRP